MTDEDARREPAPREDYGAREPADADETQPGRTSEMAEQEEAKEATGQNESA